ncbi:unnamed protein product [Calypogeia fissa]
MDKEPEEMQHLGVVGIITEAFKLMRSYGRLLASLTSTLVLPFCFVVLAHHLISDPLLDKISRQKDVMEAEVGTPAGDKLRHQVDGESVGYFVLAVCYLLFVLAFSLLAFAAIVYSVACIYTGKGVSYTKVLSVVPRVWKRLMVTLLWAYLIMFAYQLAFVIAIVILLTLAPVLGVLTILFGILLGIGFLIVVVWLKMIWDMASVVSVLEDAYGLGAVRKSLHLLRGKRLDASILAIIYALPNAIVSLLFQVQVVHSSGSIWWRTLNATFLISIFSGLWLMGIIVQSVLYFVCKAHHHESVDRYALSDHLDGYLGEYMPLKDPIPMEILEPEP